LEGARRNKGPYGGPCGVAPGKRVVLSWMEKGGDGKKTPIESEFQGVVLQTGGEFSTCQAEEREGPSGKR